MAEKEVCVSCRRPKAELRCEVCNEPLCKDCQEFLPEGSFSFMKEVPAILTHLRYCPYCFEQHIVPAQETYDELMQKARGVYFSFTTQKRPLPVIKRAQQFVEVKDCADRDETILRLAFLAAEQGFNCIIKAEVNSEKVRNEGYQTSKWRGIGLPAEVDPARMEWHDES